MIERVPIDTASQLQFLDNTQVLAGYLAGLQYSPLPPLDCSYSYWHGWRNGQVDGGWMQKDEAQAALAHDVLSQA